MLKNNLSNTKAMRDAGEIARMLPGVDATVEQTGDLGSALQAIKANEGPPDIPSQQKYADDIAAFKEMLAKNPKLSSLLTSIAAQAAPEEVVGG